ncbi:hypothetical protein J3E72DRAFT_241489 [Bipolaris maydis]|nr:hypothetical protein BM1_08080 [Bipolaris maydis]KAJ5020769.1 hypothetical protein J3E73DRAFT_221696 [Bipolaris maydis]KAJ5020970.1 hypothetical protein J3E73DRAFT_221430 [Bipolaris maydis]KAJ5021081.1 hypothetical protein J3E73DRAFT_241982 [Bipolaris maydis]KAJ5021518.1 hypothetical protein J3E73DRAFT_241582 [Bipolaris maydis]
MAHTASPYVLAPRLPDPSVRVNPNDYAASAKAHATSRKYMHDLFPGQNKPLPLPKDTETQNRPVYAKPSHSSRQRHVLEERLAPIRASEDSIDRRSLECLIMLDESPVRGPQRTMMNSNPVPAPLNVTKRTPSLTRKNSTTQPQIERTRSVKGPGHSNVTRRSLLQLPPGLLGHILGYVFAEERAVSITPYQSRITPQRYRHRHGPNAVDIRSVMMHPALRVCQQMRAMGLNILYRDSLFLIDLCDARSASHAHDRDAGGKHWDCWTNGKPPYMVQSVLSHACNLRFQLPVSCLETAPLLGAAKRKKDHHEDGCVVVESLRSIATLITGLSTALQPARPRSSSPVAPKALRRKLSIRGLKRHDSLEFVCRGDNVLQSPPPREPLSRLEVVLVKPGATAEVHPQTLEMIAICSSIPVWDKLEYHLELDGVRKLWAKRTMGKWVGSEPDAGKLVLDLQALGYPHPMTDLSPQNAGRVDMFHRHRSRPTQDSIDGLTHRYLQAPSKTSRSQRASKEGTMARKMREMESLSKMSLLRGAKQPPTVDEIQRMASGIR